MAAMVWCPCASILSERASAHVGCTVRRCSGVLGVLLVALALMAPLARANYDAGLTAYDVGDYAKAYAEWLPLARQGDARAQFKIGVMYQQGLGVGANSVEAMQWYRMAANQGHARAQYRLGGMYEKRRWARDDAERALNKAEAVRWYHEAANQGYADAQVALGLMYEKGRVVGGDLAKAVDWYRKAADQGNATAQARLGIVYLNGRGVVKDEAEAVRWFHKAADQGSLVAQDALGNLYWRGFGITQDYAAAVRWWRQAADQGLAQAQLSLGLMYEKGHGVAQDDAAAVRWYRKAADQGDEIAEAVLARLENQMHQAAVEEAERQRIVEERSRAEDARRVKEALRAAEEEAQLQHIADLTEGLVPTDVIAAIMNEGAVLRVLPEREAEAVRQLAKGRQVQVTGVLPTGWLRIAEEGMAAGWIFKTALAPAVIAQINQPRGSKPGPAFDAVDESVFTDAAFDLWRGFRTDRSYKIAVANIKPPGMEIDNEVFRRANNALERALARTGEGRGHRMIARTVLPSIISALEREGLGDDPDAVRRKLIEDADAEVLIVAEYYPSPRGFAMSLQAVRVKDGLVLSTSREFLILLSAANR